MKIEQLLEAPVTVDPVTDKPLTDRGEAGAKLDAQRAAKEKPTPALSQFGTVGAKRAATQGVVGGVPTTDNNGLPQAGTNQQPTTLGAPQAVQAQADQQDTPNTNPVWKSNRNPDAPAVARPDELANIKKNAGLPAKPEPVNLTATPADDEQGTAVAPAAAKKPGVLDKFKDKAKSFWDYANTDKSGEDAANFGAGVRDAAGSVSRGVQNTVTGAGNLAQGVAPGLVNVANATGDVAQGVGQGLQKGLKGAAHVVGGLGDVGSEITGGLSKMVGAAKGGYNHGRDKYYAQGTLTDKAKDAAGWKDAARQNFADPRQGGMTPAQQNGSSSSAPVQNTGYSGGGDEVSQLKARLDKIEQRLGGAA